MKRFRIVIIGICILASIPLVAFAGSVIEIGPNLETHSVITINSGGTDAENGLRLLDAIDKETKRLANRRVLIKLEPGNYDIGVQTIYLSENMNLEGSGKDITTITGNASACDLCLEYGVLQGASKSEVRNLTIQNLQTSLDGVPITVVNKSGPSKYTNIKIIAKAVHFTGIDVIGMLNIHTGAIYLEEVDIEVFGGDKRYGIKSLGTFLDCVEVSISTGDLNDATEAYGIYVEDSGSRIRNSKIGTSSCSSKCYGIYSFNKDLKDDEDIFVFWSEISIGSRNLNEMATLHGDIGQTFHIFNTILESSNSNIDLISGSAKFKCLGCATYYNLDPLDSNCNR